MKKILLFLSLLICACSSNIPHSDDRFAEFQSKQVVDKEYLNKIGSVITLDKALKIGLDRNLTLKTKEIEARIATLDKRIAFSNFLPKISIGFSKTMLNEKVSAKALDTPIDNIPIIGNVVSPLLHARLLDKDFEVFGANASLPIFVPSTWFLYNARSKGEDIANLTKDLTEKMIKLQIIGEYYQLLALQTEEKYLMTEIKLTEKLKENMELALKTGSVLEWENKQVETLYEMKKLGIEQNKNAFNKAKVEFLNTLNLYPFLEFDLKEPPLSEDLNITLDDFIYETLIHSDIIDIRDQAISVSDDIKRIAISNFLPKIIIDGSFLNPTLNSITNKHIFSGTLGGIFTVFNGFKDVNEYEKAKKQNELYYIKREEEIAKVILECVNAYNQLNDSKHERKIALINFQALEGMMRQKTLEHKIGEISDVDYTKAMAEYDKALSLKIKTEYKYQVSVAIVNMLMEKSIFKKEGENDA